MVEGWCVGIKIPGGEVFGKAETPPPMPLKSEQRGVRIETFFWQLGDVWRGEVGPWRTERSVAHESGHYH